MRPILLIAVLPLAACDLQPVDDPSDPDSLTGCDRARADVELLAPLTLDSFQTRELPAGNEVTGSDGFSLAVAAGPTDVVCLMYARVVDDALGDLPNCGSLTGWEPGQICHSGARGAPEGEQMVVAMTYVDLLLPDEDREYQYSVVFENDTDPYTGFQADPMYPSDFWYGADRVLELPHRRNYGWSIYSSGWDEDGTRRETSDSQARAFVEGHTLMVVAPVEELGDPTGLRVAAFEHEGSYLDGAWTGDVEPAAPDFIGLDDVGF